MRCSAAPRSLREGKVCNRGAMTLGQAIQTAISSVFDCVTERVCDEVGNTK
jgi:hypothetical protein